MSPKPATRDKSTIDGNPSANTNLDTPVTYRGLDDATLTKHLNKTIEALQTSLEATTALANNALALIAKLEKELSCCKRREQHA